MTRPFAMTTVVFKQGFHSTIPKEFSTKVDQKGPRLFRLHCYMLKFQTKVIAY